jgi:hypothetical protein
MAKTGGPYHKLDSKVTPSTTNLWRERQLRDYRKANGLCFFCGEKFDLAHIEKCQHRTNTQVHALALNDLDQNLTEEVLNQLEVEDTLAEDLLKLSLNAISGTESTECIKIRSLVYDKVMLILLDSGSSHSFVSTNFVAQAGLSPVPTMARQVHLPNGQVLISDQMVPQLEWWCQGFTLATDMRVLELEAYDAILGYDWLKSHSPMTCHWADRTLEFRDMGRDIKLQGVKQAPLSVQAMEAEQLWKCAKGNDIWAFAVVKCVKEQAEQVVPEDIQSLIDEYTDLFQEPKQLPPSRVYDHAIPLQPDSMPINCRPYKYSPQHKTEIERQVKELLQAGLIAHSTSPFASPVLLVQKKDGTWRFCVDYRRLSAMTIKNKFPMPTIEEILDELAGAKYFTKLDMRLGYHQVRVKEGDEFKTAFKTHHGHYEFKVMPFGLTNAPSTFRCLMNEILQPFLRQLVMVFLDDILIYSPTLAEHTKHIQQVLEVLRKHKIYLKFSKCSFAQKSMEYLGHIISVDGVATDPAKTIAMLQWPKPATVTELRGFLGLTGCYRKFVKGYGILARPLTQLLRKKSFEWSPDADKAFHTLKSSMMSTLVLALPNFNEVFTIETDACADGIGAVLMQRG